MKAAVKFHAVKTMDEVLALALRTAAVPAAKRRRTPVSAEAQGIVADVTH